VTAQRHQTSSQSEYWPHKVLIYRRLRALLLSKNRAECPQAKDDGGLPPIVLRQGKQGRPWGQATGQRSSQTWQRNGLPGSSASSTRPNATPRPGTQARLVSAWWRKSSANWSRAAGMCCTMSTGPAGPKQTSTMSWWGPGGVVVVDAKNWTGEVKVSSGVLWQGRYARTQAVEGALAQCAAVASVLAPPHRRMVRPLICMAAQPDLFGVTNSDVAVVGAQRVVGAIEALPAVLDQQSVVGLYAHLGQQLTHEQEPGITAFRSVRPGTVVRPAGPRPASPGADGHPDPAEPRPVPARSVSSRQAPSRAGSSRTGSSRTGSPRAGATRAGAPGAGAIRPAGDPSRAAAGGRNPKARQRRATGAGRLALLAAFVIFAVYVLPYLGR
jgi:hypothetical protein